jgi:hypothetical protein
MEKLKPGRRTATLRFQNELFPHHATSAMREAAIASHFIQVCAGSITRGRSDGRFSYPPEAARPKAAGWGIYPSRNAQISSLTVNAFLTLSDVTEW